MFAVVLQGLQVYFMQKSEGLFEVVLLLSMNYTI